MQNADKNDENTTIKELKNLVKNFCEERDWDKYHNPKDLAIGISTEANELLDIFRFKNKEEIKQMLKGTKRVDIGEELADVFYFILRFSQMNNFDLSEELKKKLEKNDKKYPVDKAKGSNKKYDEL
ncbi:MAG: nucleotide pyrophosphohydrolase [Minisyncoccia bacterium]